MELSIQNFIDFVILCHNNGYQFIDGNAKVLHIDRNFTKLYDEKSSFNLSEDGYAELFGDMHKIESITYSIDENIDGGILHIRCKSLKDCIITQSRISIVKPVKCLSLLRLIGKKYTEN